MYDRAQTRLEILVKREGYLGGGGQRFRSGVERMVHWWVLSMLWWSWWNASRRSFWHQTSTEIPLALPPIEGRGSCVLDIYSLTHLFW